MWILEAGSVGKGLAAQAGGLESRPPAFTGVISVCYPSVGGANPGTFQGLDGRQVYPKQ